MIRNWPPSKDARALCDAAPVVDLTCLREFRKPVTLIMPYYENPDFVQQQIAHWWTYAPDLREHLRVIMVDDGSPRHPLAPIIRAHYRSQGLPCDMRIFRIEKDVRWNWLAARNIGAYEAGFLDSEQKNQTAIPPYNPWLLITDMDHVVPEVTLRAVIYGNTMADTIYRFSRQEHTGEIINPHPNSWFYTRAMYWRIGGHDEALSGHYGTDGEYRARCGGTAPIRIISQPLIRYERLGDSSTRHYERKQPEDAKAKQIIKARPKNWQPKVLSFKYHEESLL